MYEIKVLKSICDLIQEYKLLIDESNMISGMKMCIDGHKKHTLNYMNSLNFNTIAIGDSLNDLGMLQEAGVGILFRSSNDLFNLA